jgi:molybdenum cofactor biosynthesis enzyme MoaA
MSGLRPLGGKWVKTEPKAHPFVELSKKQNAKSTKGQAMQNQHTTEEMAQREGILVPLELPELHILSQEWQKDGVIRVEVIAKTTQIVCPHCKKWV